MLKTGIHSIAQLDGENIVRGQFGGRRKISVTLYPMVAAQSDGDEMAEAILHQFTDSRRAFKRTYARRFPAFDSVVSDRIAAQWPGKSDLSVHDAGVSDARTAVDFFNVLSGRFSGLSYTASDYNPRLIVVEKGRLKLTLGHTGQVLEICWPPFVFNKMVRDSYKYYPLNHLVHAFVQFFLVRPLLRAYREGRVQGREFFLFAPRALQLAANDPRFTLLQHDLLSPFPAQYDVIRTMNVLNLSYFSDDEFRRIARNIHGALSDGGLFVMGSNDDAGTEVQGGIYRRTETGFEEIWRSGTGAPAREYFVDKA